MTQPSQPDAAAPAPEVSGAIERLFRDQSAKMVATLTGIFGVEHLTLAEDVVQEALARAMQTWPYYGIPKNPAAWIMQVSRNLALDVVRRQRVFHEKEAEIVHLMDRQGPSPDAEIFSEQEIADDRLRMMFVCCHPRIPEDIQAALALKTLCGFGIGEISRAFLISEAAIAKRLVRARQKIRDSRIPFEIPAGSELSQRLDGVLQTIYLLFNEGYKASSGERLVRDELCHEAIRLCGLLAEHEAGNQPRTHALLALMLLNAARLPARISASGQLLRLMDQNRRFWDQTMIARGMRHLALSSAGDEISAYHLQAAIAACHCRAGDYESTDWAQILAFYDQLMEFDASPVVALNRAVALAGARGPQAGLDALTAIPGRQELDSYYLYHAVMGEFEARLNRIEAAAGWFKKSIELVEIGPERQFLEGRLRDCGG